MSEQMKKKRGRPVGSKRGPTKSIRRRFSDTIQLQLVRGLSFSKAARMVTGDDCGDNTLHRYRHRHSEYYSLLRMMTTIKTAVFVARELMPDLRFQVEQYIDQAIDLIDKPGGRSLASEMRGDLHKSYDSFEQMLALNLVLRFKDRGLRNKPDSKVIAEWISETRDLLKLPSPNSTKH